MTGNLTRVVLIFALWISGLLAGGQFAKVSVILPELRSLYPTQAEQVAWLLTLVSVVGAVFGGLAAGIANRVGLRRILIVSLLAGGALSLWQSTYPPFALMAASRILEGMTHLGIVVTAPALMAEASSNTWRGATMALWGTFFGVSFALFGWFGIPVIDDLQISGLFQIHGLCLILVASLIVALLRNYRRPDLADDTALDGPASGSRRFRDVRVIWPGMGWLFYTLTFLALLTILPSQLSGDLRSQVTTAMSLVAIGTGILILPVALLRFKATSIVMAGFLVAALITILGSQEALLMSAICLFAVLGIIQGGTFAAVAELNIATEKRTLGYGAMAQTGNLGNLIGTPLLLFVLQTSGLETLLMATAVIYCTGFVTLILLAGRIRTALKRA